MSLSVSLLCFRSEIQEAIEGVKRSVTYGLMNSYYACILLVYDYIYIFFFDLFVRHKPNPYTAWSARSNAKKEKRRKVQRRENSEEKWIGAIDALIGEKEQNGKQKKAQKKEIGSGSPTQLIWNIWSSLTTRMDHTVGLFCSRFTRNRIGGVKDVCMFTMGIIL